MSTLSVNKLQSTAGLEYGKCLAWVNFNGTGTVAIRKAMNVSSITDNGTGDYTLNFTTALPDSNYIALVTNGGNTGSLLAGGRFDTTVPTTSACRVGSWNTAGTATDSAWISVSIFD